MSNTEKILVFLGIYVAAIYGISGLYFAGECDMTNLTTRISTCPPGSCCCYDADNVPMTKYCKPISGDGGPCYAKVFDWPASCPCPSNMTCVPNVQVATWTSEYGRCRN
ncbi:uncharacterized protein LOC127866324 [Dreissena polymorpha]|uniref:Uncharacterized protein n=1 Tax=Dreissena polymorpha TaxID=45954 RepID=A0A9D4RY18_DREPO|nr:uncharacterized protein LOC127866324 [Dreissena polymorpha]KAH3883200.1 hypothetical protein DPMN_007154 [Dreissena polymorpha]